MTAAPAREALALHAAVRGLRAGARLPILQARVVVALQRALNGASSGDAPSPARLAAQLGVARATLHHALRALERKGWLSASVEVVAVERIELRQARRITLTLPEGMAAANTEQRRAG